jgi:hypothetical protein
MNEIIAIAANPILYTCIVGTLVAFYTIWTLAKQQYLGVDKLFNLLALALASGWFGGWVVQSITNRIWESPLALDQLWVHPKPLVTLFGYIVIWLVATRYIRTIRYPYWRLMDMLFIAVAIIQSGLLLGWTINHFSWLGASVLAIAIVSNGALLWLYSKIKRSGIIAGLQAGIFFSLILALHLMLPAWQGRGSGVEWVADGVGIILGITLVLLRISARSEKVILQDIPRGVSQNFSETFTRAFNKKIIKQESEKKT